HNRSTHLGSSNLLLIVKKAGLRDKRLVWDFQKAL
ncbi:unnamed protein product, partial [Allacma fusca]